MVFNVFCRAVETCEAIVKKQYSLLGWEYKDTNSDDDNNITDCGKVHNCFCVHCCCHFLATCLFKTHNFNLRFVPF